MNDEPRDDRSEDDVGAHDAVAHDPVLDPRFERFRPLSTALQRALIAVAVLAVVTTLLPPSAARWAGALLVAMLVAVPLLRVVWFVVRWTRRGDRRYALVGVGVLVVIAIGTAIAFLQPAS